MQFLKQLFWRFQLWRTQRYLEKRLDGTGKFVEIEVVPKRLALRSFDPDRKRSGAVNGTPVEYSFSTWDGEAHFPFWKAKLSISISVGGSRPTSGQLELAKSLLSFDRYLRDEIEAKIYEYYQSQVYDSFMTLEGDEETYAPRISKPSQIRRLLSGPTVNISDEGEETTQFQLHFGCTWDEEHGVNVEFEDWQILDVGI